MARFAAHVSGDIPEAELRLISLDTLKGLFAHYGVTEPVDRARIEVGWRLAHTAGVWGTAVPPRHGDAAGTDALLPAPPPPAPTPPIPPRGSVDSPPEHPAAAAAARRVRSNKEHEARREREREKEREREREQEREQQDRKAATAKMGWPRSGSPPVLQRTESGRRRYPWHWRKRTDAEAAARPRTPTPPRSLTEAERAATAIALAGAAAAEATVPADGACSPVPWRNVSYSEDEHDRREAAAERRRRMLAAAPRLARKPLPEPRKPPQIAAMERDWHVDTLSWREEWYSVEQRKRRIQVKATQGDDSAQAIPVSSVKSAAELERHKNEEAAAARASQWMPPRGWSRSQSSGKRRCPASAQVHDTAPPYLWPDLTPEMREAAGAPVAEEERWGGRRCRAASPHSEPVPPYRWPPQGAPSRSPPRPRPPEEEYWGPRRRHGGSGGTPAARDPAPPHLWDRPHSSVSAPAEQQRGGSGDGTPDRRRPPRGEEIWGARRRHGGSGGTPAADDPAPPHLWDPPRGSGAPVPAEGQRSDSPTRARPPFGEEIWGPRRRHGGSGGTPAAYDPSPPHLCELPPPAPPQHRPPPPQAPQPPPSPPPPPAAEEQLRGPQQVRLRQLFWAAGGCRAGAGVLV